MQEVFIKIYGKVQGVFFRDEAKRLALSLDLNGWIKNIDDGTVEILAQGKAENLNKLKNWTEQGPNLAQVEKIECKYREIKNKLDNFKILY